MYLGVHNNSKKDEEPGVVRVPAAYIAIHPEYNLNGHLLNDIAIIKLAWEVELTDNIQLACLPDPNDTHYPMQTNIDGFIMGWGALSEAQNTPEILQNVIIEVLDGPEYCTSSPPEYYNWDTQICAGYLPGGKDTCQGNLKPQNL